MNWTLDQLEAFVMSVKLGSFSAAARKLGKAQSRVSTAIANLEADLGFDLFDRSARLPVLTPQGSDIYIEAQAVLSQCQRLESRAMTVSSGQELALTIALDEAVPIFFLEKVFAEIAVNYPSLRVSIINGSQDDIAKWVDEKKADIGFLFHLSELADSLEFVSIGHFRQSLIVSKDHPLAQIPVPTFTDLNQYRQLVIRDRMGESQSNPISSLHWHADSYYSITSLVNVGIGWALVPEHVANDDWYADRLVQLSTKHIPNSLVVEMGLVKRCDSREGPVSEWLYQTMIRMFSEH
ncbi:LysR family transcriptional regulator [Vibrio tapetis subsp. quintayensis]|uniref:LysR family transcriptional regulator n=1 Tax=Vibrio tapetis TaxID=52443 RepID=UPI0025B44763|nr:LysR family transcriptional regulator [Vibrio tapetis]MDN3680981.1 LysR family transcriptional regulator [Vibrio tapetis subsp. quintayensis]